MRNVEEREHRGKRTRRRPMPRLPRSTTSSAWWTACSHSSWGWRVRWTRRRRWLTNSRICSPRACWRWAQTVTWRESMARHRHHQPRLQFQSWNAVSPASATPARQATKTTSAKGPMPRPSRGPIMTTCRIELSTRQAPTLEFCLCDSVDCIH